MIPRAAAAIADVTEAVISAAPGLPAELSQGRVIAETANRPWPVPAGPWSMAQTWRDLLFMHWALAPAVVRPLLPRGLPVDTFEGRAWIGIVPFTLSGLRPRGAPPLISSFPELNVRTYTTLDDRPGVYFLSLDAGSRLVVFAARRAYRLPYVPARMAVKRRAEEIHYVSERASAGWPSVTFEAHYRPSGPPHHAAPGSLDYFLTERYCLYTTDERGMPLRAEIQHPPWELQAAQAWVARNSMTRPWGLELPDEPPVLHFSRVLNALVWPLRAV